MDDLDLRLLRALGHHPFEPWSRAGPIRLAQLARTLRVTEKTARDRVRKLEKEGAIAGYEIHLNLRHLRLDWTTYHFRVPSRTKEDALAAVAEVDGVVGIQEFVGDDVFLDIYAADDAELQRRLALLKRLLGAEGIGWYDHEMPPIARDLAPLDRRVAVALRGRARTPSATIAKELGLTSRTVERRLGAMLARGDAAIIPRIDWTRSPRLIPFALAIDADGSVVPALRRQAPTLAAADCCRSSWSATCCEPGSGTNLSLALYAESLPQMEEMRQRFATRTGVRKVDVLLPARRREPTAWIDAMLRRFADDDRRAGPRVVAPGNERRG